MGQNKDGHSIVPREKTDFPEMTVYENLLVGAYLRKDKDAIKEDLKSVLEIFPPLKERLNQLGGLLSGGEQQMLAIRCALIANPKLLMLDEPLLELAPVLQEKLLGAIEKINEEKREVLRFLLQSNMLFRQ